MLLFLLKSLDHDRLSSNDFFMFTIVLDYTDARVKILEHEYMQSEDIESLLSEEYDIASANIEYMTVSSLHIETLE